MNEKKDSSSSSSGENIMMPSTTNKVEAEPYAWPIRSSMSAETTALVVIDMQRDCKSASSGIDLSTVNLQVADC